MDKLERMVESAERIAEKVTEGTGLELECFEPEPLGDGYTMAFVDADERVYHAFGVARDLIFKFRFGRLERGLRRPTVENGMVYGVDEVLLESFVAI